MKRIIVFQMILKFIELAMGIVSVDSAIQRIKDNYTSMKDMSQMTLDKLQGASSTNAGAIPTNRLKPLRFQSLMSINPACKLSLTVWSS
jgi:hypothetical protein